MVDNPTIGIFREGDRHFLFVCLDGVHVPRSLWIYAEVRRTSEVGNFPPGVSFDDGVMNLLKHSPWVRFGVAEDSGRLLKMSDEVQTRMWRDSLLLAAASTVLDGYDLEEFGIEKEELALPAY